MKIAYCDCFSGISGDMFLGALLDAGFPLSFLQERLAELNLGDEYEIRAEKLMKGAIQATQFSVRLTHEIHGEHAHGHRHLDDIQALVNNSNLPEKVKETSLKIFDNLAEAEGKVHGVAKEAVHFHEVGAVDSIVDIVGAAIGLDYLGIEKMYSSPLPVGSGRIVTQHGELPLPAPATIELMRMAGAPIKPVDCDEELVTPTGAAILATLAEFGPPAMRYEKIGIGAGQRDLPWANILRVMIGELVDAPSPLIVLETNIDDMTGEGMGYVMQQLFKSQALDVFFSPIYMKKNRPATMLSVIARQEDEKILADIILKETTSFGVRVYPIRRFEADREIQTVRCDFGEIRVKIKRIDGVSVQAAPEYEDCARLARETGEPFQKVFNAAWLAARKLLG